MFINKKLPVTIVFACAFLFISSIVMPISFVFDGSIYTTSTNDLIASFIFFIFIICVSIFLSIRLYMGYSTMLTIRYVFSIVFGIILYLEGRSIPVVSLMKISIILSGLFLFFSGVFTFFGKNKYKSFQIKHQTVPIALKP